jgi:Kef-type K+ transport system membrane component KefB
MRKQHVLCYLGLMLAFGLGLGLIFQLAPLWITAKTSPSMLALQPLAVMEPVSAFLLNVHAPLGMLLLQIVIIVTCAKGIGALFKYFNQPSVIGEMFAGILLGPSFFGWLEPGLQMSIFPNASLGSLKVLSEIGVIIFMFSIGAELDTQALRKKAHRAIVVSHVSIFFPFLLGAGFAIWLYNQYSMNGVAFNTFALFMGIAMSITAFPVLASIIRERGMTSSLVGSTAVACAAVDDVTAWCILAGIIAMARSNGLESAGITVVLAGCYIVFMLRFVKPRFDRLIVVAKANDSWIMVGTMLLVFLSSLITELIGVHALFGAFLAGVTISNNQSIRRFISQHIEPFSSSILLPLFFAYTGLRTQIGLLNDWQSWLYCGIIIAVATVGKLGGSAIAARLTGLGWRDSFSLGALMNTRGLMELVVLNIGFDLGILSPHIFAMMVIMALVTTLMTGPLLSLLEKKSASGRVVCNELVS